MTRPEEALHGIVSARVGSASRPDIDLGPLRSEIGAFRVRTDDHAVPWDAGRWLDDSTPAPVRTNVRRLVERFGDRPADRAGRHHLSRQNVFSLADPAVDPVLLFLAAMIWGFGTTGYGRWRVLEVFRRAGEECVRQATAQLARIGRDGDLRSVWKAWSPGGPAKLPGVGTAFASKVAYFASYDVATERGPLIADVNTAWALWALTGQWDSRASATGYASYVTTAADWAAQLGCRSDDVERALFCLGPRVRRSWRELTTP